MGTSYRYVGAGETMGPNGQWSGDAAGGGPGVMPKGVYAKDYQTGKWYKPGDMIDRPGLPPAQLVNSEPEDTYNYAYPVRNIDYDSRSETFGRNIWIVTTHATGSALSTTYPKPQPYPGNYKKDFPEISASFKNPKGLDNTYDAVKGAWNTINFISSKGIFEEYSEMKKRGEFVTPPTNNPGDPMTMTDSDGTQFTMNPMGSDWKEPTRSGGTSSGGKSTGFWGKVWNQLKNPQATQAGVSSSTYNQIKNKGTTATATTGTTATAGNNTQNKQGAQNVSASGTKLSIEQIVQLALSVGFQGDDAAIAAAVAMAESGGDSAAINPRPGTTSTSDLSYGLWQINMIGNLGPQRRQQFGLSSNEQLYDPTTNAKAAYAIYSARKGKFSPDWSTYTNGKYLNFLVQAQEALSKITSGAYTPPPIGTYSPSTIGGTPSANRRISSAINANPLSSLSSFQRQQVNTLTQTLQRKYAETTSGRQNSIDGNLINKIAGVVKSVDNLSEKVKTDTNDIVGSIDKSSTSAIKEVSAAVENAKDFSEDIKPENQLVDATGETAVQVQTDKPQESYAKTTDSTANMDDIMGQLQSMIDNESAIREKHFKELWDQLNSDGTNPNLQTDSNGDIMAVANQNALSALRSMDKDKNLIPGYGVGLAPGSGDSGGVNNGIPLPVIPRGGTPPTTWPVPTSKPPTTTLPKPGGMSLPKWEDIFKQPSSSGGMTGKIVTFFQAIWKGTRSIFEKNPGMLTATGITAATLYGQGKLNDHYDEIITTSKDPQVIYNAILDKYVANTLTGPDEDKSDVRQRLENQMGAKIMDMANEQALKNQGTSSTENDKLKTNTLENYGTNPINELVGTKRLQLDTPASAGDNIIGANINNSGQQAAQNVLIQQGLQQPQPVQQPIINNVTNVTGSGEERDPIPTEHSDPAFKNLIQSDAYHHQGLIYNA